MSTLVCSLTGRRYSVGKGRVNKALNFLLTTNIDRLASTSQNNKLYSCPAGMPRCTTKLSTNAIAMELGRFFARPKETGASSYLSDMLQAPNADLHLRTEGADIRVVLEYVVVNKSVCRTYFKAIYGVSNHKLKRVRSLVLHGHHSETTHDPRLKYKSFPRILYL